MLHARAGYRSARPTPSICSNPACNARPVHTKVPEATISSICVRRSCRGSPVLDRPVIRPAACHLRLGRNGRRKPGRQIQPWRTLLSIGRPGRGGCLDVGYPAVWIRRKIRRRHAPPSPSYEPVTVLDPCTEFAAFLNAGIRGLSGHLSRSENTGSSTDPAKRGVCTHHATASSGRKTA